MHGSVRDPVSATAGRARLAIIVPLALERQCLSVAPAEDSGPIVEVLQSGQGAANAARAARAALAKGATALMTVGVAGALTSDLRAGDAVVPSFVIDADSGRSSACSAPWAAALRERIAAVCAVSSGAVLGVSNVLTTPAAKQQAASHYGAVACDLESAAVVAVAEEAGADVSVLRIISDTHEDRLPEDVADWVDDTGKARVLPVLSEIRSPKRWRNVVTMISRFRIAQRRLHQISELLASSGYCCPQR